jgi:hypothetical protein
VSGTERCDEILKQIDEVLAETSPQSNARSEPGTRAQPVWSATRRAHGVG